MAVGYRPIDAEGRVPAPPRMGGESAGQAASASDPVRRPGRPDVVLAACEHAASERRDAGSAASRGLPRGEPAGSER